jgi:hypothetical protein
MLVSSIRFGKSALEVAPELKQWLKSVSGLAKYFETTPSKLGEKKNARISPRIPRISWVLRGSVCRTRDECYIATLTQKCLGTLD